MPDTSKRNRAIFERRMDNEPRAAVATRFRLSVSQIDRIVRKEFSLWCEEEEEAYRQKQAKRRAEEGDIYAEYLEALERRAKKRAEEANRSSASTPQQP